MYEYLKQYYLISDELYESLLTSCEQKVFSKNELLVSAGMTCNNLYLILEGFCVSYFEKDGKEQVVCFFQEGDFCTSFHSFWGNKISFYSVRANEKTTVVCISRSCFNALWQRYGDFVRLIYAIMEKQLCGFEEKSYRIRNLTPLERIRYYLETHEIQFWLKRVPQYLIASYLQMTAEHYAKLQKQLNKM
ncbi:hypothetical protein HMPREF1076_04356 [Parabacteroides goldsteinii CL02T12C30]|uniref:Cyclic nucleotide-binding domain-containing protein n=1 Tax=Parabacteroides goldsteinii CL02T12C30 TaxID=999418 RepID=K5Y801_9BACT|nr:cyclic nucleotide-binding domain-containing protein [Parabacteroides goldsteinii]EKN09327.1 hypothetical protein HMPREF1076_04356 [Parabacteroides goldsteinii CL02T12C30]